MVNDARFRRKRNAQHLVNPNEVVPDGVRLCESDGRIDMPSAWI